MRMHQVTVDDAVANYSMSSEDVAACRKQFLVDVTALLPDRTKNEYRESVSCLVTDDQLVVLTIDPRFTVEVNQTTTLTTGHDMSDIVRKFELVARRMEDVASKHDFHQDNYNAKCEVHTPGNTLTLYNEVAYHLDMCSEELQETLNEGWRIIAVCPQPDQRRPDYVVGRYNPNMPC